jgi:hypothetical protein
MVHAKGRPVGIPDLRVSEPTQQVGLSALEVIGLRLSAYRRSAWRRWEVARLTRVCIRQLIWRIRIILRFCKDGTDQVTTELVDGREVRGGKNSLRDTGSWVPLLASWPGKIKSGSIYDGLVDFTDIMPTCLELAKASVPNGIDGISFASQLQGHPGQPREWVHSLYKTNYFVRDSKWKLRENGNLYDVSNSPFSEPLVVPEKETVEAKSARQRLQGILDRLHP